MSSLPILCTLCCGVLAFAARPVPDFGVDFIPSQEGNMNGDYVFSPTPNGTPGLFPKQYKDYPGGVEFYDVYSPPITTLYSQVWWSPLAPTQLPEELVDKYNGKGMAIVGWEIDQVRRTSEGDVSVPISASYNHHYVAQMIGGGARFEKVQLDGPNDPRAAELKKTSHGTVAYDQPQYIVVEPDTEAAGPTRAQFSSANGGEYRKTYHGFAPGHALVINSPTAMQITPMQIDTWNRDAMNISANAKATFVPGPLPRASLAPQDATYSGLLECPMTTRITKQIDGTYTSQTQGNCQETIQTFQECYHAAATTIASGGQTFVNSTGSDANQPAGCSATLNMDTHTVNVFFNKLSTSKIECAAGAETIVGFTDSLVQTSVSLSGGKLTMTLRGPSTVWYGVGVGARAMSDQPWTIVVDGTGAVTEHKLADQKAGTVLKPSVTVVSNVVDSGVRTVVVTRPLEGAGPDYYTFNMTSMDTSIPIINAVGSTSAFSYHKDKIPTSLTLLSVDKTAGTCVCPESPKPFGQASGSLIYHKVANQSADTGAGAVGFQAHKCAEWPATGLNEQRNPTCDIRYYRGGQWACHHMWSLLDADQEIPWPDQPLVFHHKYRLWVQPYDENYHTPLTLGETVGSALLIGSPWELDVPKCAPGVPGCSLLNGNWIHTITGNTVGKHSFVALNFHCHAPTCLSMEVYACSEGTPLPDCNSTNGKLLCRQQPVYGGSNNSALVGTRFDETGYIAIPDCFWGDAKYGLESPVNVTGLTLHMVKTSNATYGHYGEMAGGQPWVVL